MQIDVPFPAFKQLVTDVQAVFQASDLGSEAVRADQAVCRLIAYPDRLEVEAQYRGLEVVGQVAGDGQAGQAAVPFGQLGRLAVQAATCRLSSGPGGLDVRAGRLRATFPLVDPPAPARRQGPAPDALFSGPVLKHAIDTVEMAGLQDRQPFVRIRTDQSGARVWTHNPFNAGYCLVDRDDRRPADLVVPAGVVRAMGTAGTFGIGQDSSALTFQTDRVTCWHPVRTVAIEDLDQVLGAPVAGGFVVQADELAGALGALKSASGAITPATTVTLDVRPDKGRVIIQAGKNRYAVDLAGDADACSFQCNAAVLSIVCRRLKGQAVTIVPPGDRITLQAGTTSFVMAPIQDQPDIDEGGTGV
jgi:hypothetical protein